jgi:hypothetical protein
MESCEIGGGLLLKLSGGSDTFYSSSSVADRIENRMGPDAKAMSIGAMMDSSKQAS